MRLILLFLVLIFAAGPVFPGALDGVRSAGLYSLSAFGYAGVNMAEAVNSNPAVIFIEKGREIKLGYNLDAFDVKSQLLIYRQKARNLDLHFSFFNAGYGDIEINYLNPDLSFKETKTINAKTERLFVLGGSGMIGKRVSAGLNLKYYNPVLAETFSTNVFLADFGMLAKLNYFSAGIALRNIGGKLKYVSKSDDLSSFGAGVLVPLYRAPKISLVTDITMPLGIGVSRAGIGIEISPDANFSFRAGTEMINDYANFSFGLKAGYRGLGLEFFYTGLSTLGSRQGAALSYRF